MQTWAVRAVHLISYDFMYLKLTSCVQINNGFYRASYRGGFPVISPQNLVVIPKDAEISVNSLLYIYIKFQGIEWC